GGGGARRLRVWDVAPRRARPQRPRAGSPPAAPAFTPDGRLFVVVRSGRSPAPLALAEPLRGARATFALPWHVFGLAGAPALSPDGAVLAACDVLGRLRAFTLPGVGGQAVPLLEGRDVQACGWLPDGSLLTFGRRGGVVNVWPAAALRG